MFRVPTTKMATTTVATTTTTTTSANRTAGNISDPGAYYPSYFDVINIYYTPFLVAFGAIGHLISMFVFMKSRLKYHSSSYYLMSLAISDSMYLLLLVPPWLLAVQLASLFHTIVLCHICIYMSYVTTTFSSWVVAAFTLERFMAVCYPLRKSHWCTKSRTKTIISAILAMSLLTNLPVLFFVDSMRGDCGINYEYLANATHFNLFDTVFTYIGPSSLVIIFNVGIVKSIIRSRHGHRVTRMLLLVSSVFIMLNAPAYTMRILVYAYDTVDDTDFSIKWSSLQQIAILLFDNNFGINFIIYCMSGSNFREALRDAFRNRGHRSSRLCRRQQRMSEPIEMVDLNSPPNDDGLARVRTMPFPVWRKPRRNSLDDYERGLPRPKTTAGLFGCFGPPRPKTARTFGCFDWCRKSTPRHDEEVSTPTPPLPPRGRPPLFIPRYIPRSPPSPIHPRVVILRNN